MKRWLVLFSIVGLMLAATLLVVHKQQERHRHSARFEQIQVGMTEDEVRAVLAQDDEVVFNPGLRFHSAPSLVPLVKNPTIYVVLDERGLVAAKWRQYK
jgi:hypothetical protein